MTPSIDSKSIDKKFYGEKLQNGLYRIKCKACNKIYHTCFGDKPFCSLQCREAGKIAQRLTSRRNK